MTTGMKILGETLAAFMLALGGNRWAWLSSPTDPAAIQVTSVLERGPQHLKQVALTFDSEVGTEGLQPLLALLHDQGVRATFFLDGRWASANPACARGIAAEGHEIGNQSWGHKNLTTLDDWEIKREILLADDRFVSWFGSQYQSLFRAPFGAIDGRVTRIASQLGFHTIGWSIDPCGEAHSCGSAEEITNRVNELGDTELDGAILRFQLGRSESSAALPVIIQRLRERGFRFVPVSTWIPTPIAIVSS
jgi:peptidoglycan/xylan/chitin deacetylase (PgdA/CDA1 family)